MNLLYVSSFSKVTAFTMLSRVLGLIRDILLFAALGSGVASSAFIFAFTLPNLFRRLLGEGALMSSSIPVLAEVHLKEGDRAAFRLLNGILTRLLLVLAVMTVLAVVVFQLLRLREGLEERWYLGLHLSSLLFPYVILICLSAIVCGMLQVLHRFGPPAMSQVWLNLAMICGLMPGLLGVAITPEGRVWVLAGAVVFGGGLQLFFPAADLFRRGWRPAWHLESSPQLNQVIRLFLPGVLGAAIFQINILVSRMLAFSLDDQAAGLLYMASRLIELPLGLFAIGISTVIFPQLAREAAMRNRHAFQLLYSRGLRLVFAVTIPAAIGLFLLSNQILIFLFEWGRFDATAVSRATPVLQAAAIGLPFFAWSTFLSRAFYSFQDMRRPVVLAAVNLVINLCLSIIGMIYLGAVGLALANSVSSMVHCLLLHRSLHRHHLHDVTSSRDSVWPVAIACVLMAVVCQVLLVWSIIWSVEPKIRVLVTLIPIILVSIAVYAASLWLMRAAEWQWLRDWWRQWSASRQSSEV